MIRHTKKSLLALTVLACFIALLSKCIGPAQSRDARGIKYAGAEACRQCHQPVYDSFINTAHHKASSLAGAMNIAGNFTTGKNVFAYDSSTRVVMEKRDSGFYQVLYKEGEEKSAYRFDILFGKRHAQTGLYWQNDRLYELPITHYQTINNWATSPGFPADQPHFRRVVDADCFDCHSSNIAVKNTGMNNDPQYDKQSLILGIDCERCHGPAINHVNYHRQNPEVKTAAWLVRNKDLTRQQKLDACAICHSGNDKMKIQSRFEFQMGDTLGYFFMPFGGSKPAEDVHGNQLGLLMQSKCFSVNTMTCGTCHDPHKDANENIAVYSQKCMTCHQPGAVHFCPKAGSPGENIKSNCIDCHMPKQPSTAISYYVQGSKIKNAYLLRTHKIAVYADSTRDISHKLK
jgi:hypothetical protein